MPQGTGYINFQTLLGLNRDSAERDANRVAGNINQQGQAVQQGLGALQGQFDQGLGAAGPYAGPGSLQEMDPARYGALGAQARNVAGQAGALQNGGLGAVMQQQVGGGAAYTPGMSRYDAALAGAAGGQQLAQAGSAYSQLAKSMGAANQGSMTSAATAKARPAPAAPAAAGPAAPAEPAEVKDPRGAKQRLRDDGSLNSHVQRGRGNRRMQQLLGG